MPTLICTPINLCMTPTCCHYCGAPNAAHVTVHMMEGILACERHLGAAQRDVDAYLHESNMVRIEDGRAAAPAFFAALPPTFSVKRSSGAMDPGWALPNEDHDRVYLRRRSSEGEWLLSVEKKSEAIAKSVPFDTFLGIDGMTEEIIATLTAALDSGFYKAAATEQAALKAQGASAAPATPDHPDILRAYISKNGADPVACRLFVPS